MKSAAEWVGEAEGWYETALDRSTALESRSFMATMASSAALIAAALVFNQDADQVAAQARDEVEESMARTIRGGTVALERMAEATRILQEARRSGPRHPAILAALDALTGTSEAKEGEPRQPG